MLIISVTDFSYSSPITKLLSPTAPLDVVDASGVGGVVVVDGVVVVATAAGAGVGAGAATTGVTAGVAATAG